MVVAARDVETHRVPGRGAVSDRGQPEGQTTPARDYGLIGQNNMRLFKAGIAVPDLCKTPKAASIYIYPDALDKVFAAAADEATDVDLWEAQVHLWIVEDIVSVIAKINAEALKASGKAAATVPDSAIKRLIEISVPKGYVVSNASVGEMRPGAPGRNFRPGREPVPGRGPRGVGDGLGGGSGSETLTRRATNTTYDAKHYTVTVVMNVRYLPALQMLLLRDNQHTILNITMDSVDASDAGGDLHYYGTGAVMKVTLQGELLMLADWTRGRWESTAGKTSAPTAAGGRGRGGRSDVRRAAPVAGQWSKTYPPLMPAKVLAEIHNLNPAALRPADTQRMNDGTR